METKRDKFEKDFRKVCKKHEVNTFYAGFNIEDKVWKIAEGHSLASVYASLQQFATDIMEKMRKPNDIL